MWVVQTPSPWAMVASRWTWLPSSRANTSVSASHSCGNSLATCATGQWCWQSWSPVRPGLDRWRRSRRRSARAASAVAVLRRAPPRPARGSGARARRPARARTPRPRRRRPCRAGSAAPSTARSSYAWSNRSATGVGQARTPGPDGRGRGPRRAAGVRASTRPVGDQVVEMAADARPASAPSRAARSAAVDGPFSRIERDHAVARRHVAEHRQCGRLQTPRAISQHHCCVIRRKVQRRPP